jgi:hypothetical protein
VDEESKRTKVEEKKNDLRERQVAEAKLEEIQKMSDE